MIMKLTLIEMSDEQMKMCGNHKYRITMQYISPDYYGDVEMFDYCIIKNKNSINILDNLKKSIPKNVEIIMGR